MGAAELGALLRGGTLSPTSHVHEEGTTDWVELRTVVERLPRPAGFARGADAGAVAGGGGGGGGGGGTLARAGGFRSSSPVRGGELSASPIRERKGDDRMQDRGQERRSSVGRAPVFPKRLSSTGARPSSGEARRGSETMQHQQPPPDVTARTGRARVSSVVSSHI